MFNLLCFSVNVGGEKRNEEKKRETEKGGGKKGREKQKRERGGSRSRRGGWGKQWKGHRGDRATGRGAGARGTGRAYVCLHLGGCLPLLCLLFV